MHSAFASLCFQMCVLGNVCSCQVALLHSKGFDMVAEISFHGIPGGVGHLKGSHCCLTGRLVWADRAILNVNACTRAIGFLKGKQACKECKASMALGYRSMQDHWQFNAFSTVVECFLQ